MNQAQARRVQEVLTAHEVHLINIPGVVGVGVEMTKRGDRAAIHVFVDVVTTGGMVPEALPHQLEDVPVRVIQTDAPNGPQDQPSRGAVGRSEVGGEGLWKR